MRSAGLSDQGKTRSSNQDEYLLLEDKHGNFLAIVCDGVGGGNHGETASRMTILNMAKRFNDNEGFKDLADMQAWLFTSIKQTNQLVVARGSESEEYRGMGTTLVCFLSSQYGSLIANVGDSRAYALYEDRTFKKVTQDHSYVAKLVQDGHITEEEAMVHPQRHVITNAIGIWDDVTVDFYNVDETFKTILLCSDGIHDYISEKTISHIIKDKRLTPDTQVQRLIQEADKAGGFDNATAIVIQLDGGNQS